MKFYAPMLVLIATATLSGAQVDGGSTQGKGGKWWQILEDFNLDFVAISDDDDNETIGIGYEIKKDLGSSLALSLDGNISFDSDVNPSDFLESDLRWDKTLFKEWTRFEWQLIGSGLVGYDTDQRFDSRHLRYGIKFELEAADAGSKTLWNFFDYPFALTRAVSGFSDKLEPQAPFPSFFMSLEQVSPQGDDPRSSAGDNDDFPRLKLEVEQRANMFSTTEEQFVVFLKWRYFYEIGAEDSVEDANLDQFSYFQADFIKASKEGVFARYVAGQLPFDQEDDHSVQVGWSTNL